ncbi:MAG: hypothetical protein GAK28_04785 [Luteibacter sp.]|uniref:hypothetical protein n=1 Tax=Luteibacter sp. TaxID=1886636 RepID=UPI0013825246|nr:hypothetical protein [Luteibacter sp.]KAF1003346.1 MAG: hypothetical protein GAK28_04785 [Luteibacter sp.]
MALDLLIDGLDLFHSGISEGAHHLNVLGRCGLFLQLMPPENNRTTNPYPMTSYAEAARLAALQGRHGFVDLQWDVGDPANFGAAYAYANPNRSWWMSDLTHPNLTEAQPALAAGWLRTIFK